MLNRTLDSVRGTTTFSSLKDRHPFMFKCGYEAWHAMRLPLYRSIYERFKTFTMLGRSSYINNLSLCDSFHRLEGSVVEAGAWKGGMSAGIAKLLGDGRAYYLYDSFEGLPPASDRDHCPDGSPATQWQAERTAPGWEKIGKGHGNLAVDSSFAEQAMMLSEAKHYHITAGWFKDTLPTYNGGPIAILRMDGDFYQSVVETLEHLYRHVVTGGIIIIDDYYYWQGARRAVHDFLSRRNLPDTIRQHRDGYPYILKHR